MIKINLVKLKNLPKINIFYEKTSMTSNLDKNREKNKK